jgi:REP element-mobilizing transposase RayT
VIAKRESYLPGFDKSSGKSHGGELSLNKRKSFRPIDPKQALHVVLRSSKARGELSLLHPKHCNSIHRFVQKSARRWGIRVYRFANVGNHIHLLIQVPTREAWKRFAKELSGGIAQIVTGAQKGSSLARSKDNAIPESAKRGFWDHLLFTRIVSFGRDFTQMGRYLIKNLFESAGVPMKRLLAQGCRIQFISKDGLLSPTPS